MRTLSYPSFHKESSNLRHNAKMEAKKDFFPASQIQILFSEGPILMEAEKDMKIIFSATHRIRRGDY